uniref:Proteasome assembly chaperone 1 n=1 Tax=Heliothis virescens TaxID=7102 RepID=A0A2A4JA04_HELVI
MSTFGEINEPSSRTAWEDWDDIFVTDDFLNLRLEKDVDIPKEIDTFIILEGRYLYDCVRAHHNLELVNSNAEVNLCLFKTKELNNYVCMIRDYNLILSSEIVELLKKYITISKDVIAIVTKPIVEYQVSELVSKDYVIRSISSSKQSTSNLDIHFPNLEQPNIISGVSAGVLCWREIIDKPAVAIICYMEHPEEQQIQELYELLERFKIIPDIAKFHRDNLFNSNLYI